MLLDNSLRDLFLLNQDVVFLNHGSFGACPKPVFEVYQNWQRELEYQPVEFLGRRYHDLVDTARESLAQYINADSEDIIFITNATSGVNIVARSLDLQVGDEILTTNHEYGAVDHTWQYVAQKTGASYIQHPFPLPMTTHDDFVDSFWQSVTPKTKVIAMSHITSPTALTFPVQEICRRAREAGIITVIDGAHVPGQLPLDLNAIDADFYTGNLHKWLCTPKGAAFLYARREHHDIIDPQIISWGWIPEATFVSRNQWQGTNDISAWLSVPSAIEFQEKHQWEDVRKRCHELVVSARNQVAEITGLPHIVPESWFAQLSTMPMREGCDVLALKTRLYDEFKVEIPAIVWDEKPYLRIAIQGYNTADDVTAFVTALRTLLVE